MYFRTYLVSAVVAALLCVAVFGVKIRYEGYKVYRVTPLTEEHVAILKTLQEERLTFWHGPSEKINQPSDIMFAPHQLHFLEGIQDAGLNVQEYIQDIQTLMNEEKVSTLQNGEITWDSYYRLADIHAWLETQASQHSDIANTFVIGKSTEGRDLLALNISKSGGGTKPVIFLDANIHAREWITSAVATYIINELLNNPDSEIQSWTDDFDWVVLPVLNPDGLEYSHETDRMWRKTRSVSNTSTCRGADGNRNYDYFWFTGGSSSNPCSDVHAGTRAFSEPETKGHSDFINTIAHRMPFYVSLHSYGQWILIPFGHNNDRIPQYNTFMRIGNAAAAAHAERNGTVFTPGNVVDLLYVASGETFDWVKGVHNTNLTYIYELRDKGRYGFLLPPTQIVDTAEEFKDGLKVIINELRNGIPSVDP
ncbi:unnamed protein product [Orchesella dallaii]|uniref:Peptidase M14 domain-containing protein n=1 Tax=Orchesella dallaii TaxID=48710 RepID=A0ABP1PRL3_9HEXA